MARGQARILLVDDEQAVQTLLTYPLRKEGYEVVGAMDGQEALNRFTEERFDLVVLDIMLPKLDGIEVCRRLRTRSQVPIIMLTAKGDEIDKVAGLEMGADDYITKPFGARELVARCRSVLRRTKPRNGSVVRAGDLEVDVERYEARRQGQPVDLTTKELGLLVALARRPGVLVRREELAEEVWGTGLWPVNRSLDVHMSSLRRKLGDTPRQPRYVQTVHGLGFRLLP
jgi:DNA-binding response OmpR family regulator